MSIIIAIMLSVVIQAGGQSSRMGQDKALLPFLGRPLIERVLGRVSAIADEVVVITNRPKGYHYLNIPLFPDVIPERGALGGLYTALKVATHPKVAVVACDMPFANADILTRGRDILNNSNIDAVIPKTMRGLEPLHAVYRRDSCLPAVEAAIQADKWRMIAWHDDVNIHYLSQEEIHRVDPQKYTFMNLNTPEEFQTAEKLAQQHESPQI